MRKPKSRRLNCYLIKEGVTSAQNCVREDVHVDPYPLDPESGVEGHVFIGDSKEKEPAWVEFLETGIGGRIEHVPNVSNRGVLLVAAAGRYFAFTFGYGRHLLKEELIEHTFGLRVAVNAIEHDKLRSIDVANLEELSVRSRTDASVLSSKEVFGVDVTRDLLRAVTGTPRDPKLASVLTGRDGVAFSAPLHFAELPAKCAALMECYLGDAYKQAFDWIDNLNEVRDRSLTERLEQRLVDDLRHGRTDRAFLAPPDVLDWDDVDGFSFTRTKGNSSPHASLLVEDFLEELPAAVDVTIDVLKKRKVVVHYTESGEAIPKWPIYKCLTYEVDHDVDRYVLTLGHWYRVDRVFARGVSRFVETMGRTAVSLPPCTVRTEAEYNSMAADENPRYHLLDQVNVWCETARTSVEPCDILTEDLQFVHVKRKDSSSNLSHLFAQARAAGESMLKDPSFRPQMVERAKEKYDDDISFVAVDAALDPKTCEIVLAIIDPNPEPLHRSLPFFSQLNLRQTVQTLGLFGFRVTVAQIADRFPGRVRPSQNRQKRRKQ